MSTYSSLCEIIKKNNLSNKIITSDPMAWVNYPEYQFIYNKLWIAQSQFIDCGPMNVYPQKYPVIFKPIINLIGMSRGIKKINNEKEYDKYLKDGFFWEEFLDGDHYCIDLVLSKGNILFYSCLLSHPGENGSFDYHESIPEFELPEHIELWINNFLKDYTGCLNLEVINGIIIEAHLRLNGDYHLYNEIFSNKISDVYEGIDVTFYDYKVEKLFLIPIFVYKDFSKEVDKNRLMKEFLDNKITNVMLDNINSKYQSEYLSRFLIFSCDNLNKGFNIRNLLILKYFQL